MIGTSAGYRPRTTRETPLENRPDDGDCAVCGDPADGIDAPTRQPICCKCATIRTDGGRVEKHLHVAVDAHGNPVHLYRDLDAAEAAVESDAYAYSHVAGVWPDVPLISASPSDIDRGDGTVPDGGREPVASTGGGRHAPTMDGSTTPERTYAHYCDEVGSTVYAPRRKCPLGCYEDDDRDRGDGVKTDGGLLTGGGRYHVVCSDCTFEDLKRERHQAAHAVDDHRDDEPSHDVRFEEVRGR